MLSTIIPLHTAVFGAFLAPTHPEAFDIDKARRLAQRRQRSAVKNALVGALSGIVSQGGTTPTSWRFAFLDARCESGLRIVTVHETCSSESENLQREFKNSIVPAWSTNIIRQIPAIPPTSVSQTHQWELTTDSNHHPIWQLHHGDEEAFEAEIKPHMG